MNVLAGGIGLTIAMLFCGLLPFARPSQLRPRLVCLKPQFGLRTLFMVTCLCAGLCVWQQTAHVMADVAALTACWTICGLIGAVEGASWRGIGVWRGRAFAGALGGATGGAIFAVTRFVFGRPNFAFAGDLQHEWPHIACVLIWGLCIGTLIGCCVGGLKIIDRQALLAWSQSSAASPVRLSQLCGNTLQWLSTFGGWPTVAVACVASLLIHFAVLHSPAIPLPGGLSNAPDIATDLEIVLDVIPASPRRQPAVQFASFHVPAPTDDSQSSGTGLPSALTTSPSPQEKLRVARERTGVDAPLCLEGHCPVDLVKKSIWTKGEARIYTVYQGRTYRFTSEQAKRAFIEQPDSYSVSVSGYDPVLLLDENRLVEGERTFGVFFGKCIYLFSSERTLEQFRQQKERYASGSQAIENALAESTQQPVSEPSDESVTPLNGQDSPTTSKVQVDLIEVNHFKNSMGKILFTQVLFWSTYPDGKLHIRDWRLVKTSGILPKKNGNVWVSLVKPKRKKKGSKGSESIFVEAPAYRETTTTFDPELEDRLEVGQPDRIPLLNR